ncbi:hypothetical protein LQF76_06850 [Gloeomargaritales cyanobacterium VI4D9]|nr:hypothetical protein LQF76_06850 [Gloeomargaritales cyanobacterium VI4D9]
MSHPHSRQKRRSLPRFRPGIVSWLLGAYYRGQKNSGFILPTATLLIVVAFLIMISLLARTANRVALVSGQRERIAVEGPSAESVDRARAKIEFLFTREKELPTNPLEDTIEDFLGNRQRDLATKQVVAPRKLDDIYTLPDENRCQAQNGDCVTTGGAFTPDGIAPTWSYRVDLNGNGTVDDPTDGIAVYSILGRVFRDGKSAVPVSDPGKTHLTKRQDRAANFLVNNAPTKAESPDEFCEGALSGTVDGNTGRFLTGSSAEELKNFQIYALTIPNRQNDATLTSNAVVFQQDRRFTGANKWGAYFRYDLEIFPGPQFNWNGAMHTEGSLFITSGGPGFNSYLISAPNSCYFLPSVNSQISARGLFMTGTVRDGNNNPGNSVVHLQPAGRIAPTQLIQLSTTGGFPNPTGPGTFASQDSVLDRFVPEDLAMDPLYLITNNLPVARRREGGSESYSTYKDPNWGGALASRIQVDKCEAPPYVDDTFRADDRLGPKPSYARGSCDGAETWESLGKAGDPITGKPEWTSNNPPADAPDEYGVDGYWERRALGQGMKVIVGQRLELGNVGVWGGWRSYFNFIASSWNDDSWRFWAGLGGSFGWSPTARIYQPTTTPYFSGAVPLYSQEIFGFLMRPRPTIGNIPAPGAADPLYPPAVLAPEFGGTSPYNFAGVPAPTFELSRLNLQLNRRTQRDNLAAVQAAAVYHHKGTPDRTLPVLCLSSTIHPGTEASYFNSITFGDPVSPASPTAINQMTRYPSSNANFVRPPGSQALFPPSDFFTGRGTANMEYGNGTNPDNPPFEVADFESGTALMKVLTNLAQFAGDPSGAFPPLQAPPGNSQVYPDPVLTMWGDYSNLRRTLTTLETGGSYADLSPADQANLHTAGCTMSLLATNVHWYLDWGYFGTGNDFYRSKNGQEPFNLVPTVPPLGTDDGSSPNIRTDLQRLAHAMRQLQDGIFNEAVGNYEVGYGILNFVRLNDSAGACTPITSINANCYNVPAEYYIAALARIRDAQPFSTATNSPYQQWNRLVYLARMLNTRLQIVRDRTYGFREYVPGQWIGVETVPTNDPGNGIDQATGTLRPNRQRLAYTIRTPFTGPYTLGQTVNLPCDLSLADIDYFGYKKPSALNPVNPNDQLVEREMVALARLCPTQPKYPSLYYLFPGDLNSTGEVDGADNHGHDGTSGINRRNSSDPSPYNQPSGSAGNNQESFSEPYVLSRYIAEDANDLATYEAVKLDDLNELRLQNRQPGPTRTWKLPVLNLVNNQPVTTTDLYQRETDLIVSESQPANAHANLSAYRTGLAEKALYDGRQLQMVRVMDFDIDLLRRVNQAPESFEGDAWLTVGQVATATTKPIAGGIIYAFREDAKREDALLRPANADWPAYETSWKANFTDGPPVALQMNPDPRTPSDPPTTPVNISGKPVDYYADPDRRVHGFRLMNGNDVSRVGVTPPERNIFGMSFITDNPVYIMTQLARGISGFNLHMRPAGGVVQEFNTLLPFPYNFNQFYVNRTNRDLGFATATGDTWRPVEILADAITLITHNFCDAYQENGIRNIRNTTSNLNIPGKDNGGTGANGDCNGSANGGPSARNTTAITNPGVAGFATPEALPRDRWAREHPYDEASPIIVGSDGSHRTQTTGTQAIVPLLNYQGINLRAAVPLRNTDYQVNAVIVSGIVPSRRQQPYGGLHNFPRFIETGNALTIQGSLLQLGFSNYATAPFDFDSFERGQFPLAAEFIPYYGPPTRLWGYDPGLQYAPAGPVAQRFINPSNARNEYFLELTANDPYTCQMKRFVVPGITCP